MEAESIYEKEEFESGEEFLPFDLRVVLSELKRLSVSIQKLDQKIISLSNSISGLNFRLNEIEKEKSRIISTVINGSIIAFSAFIITGISVAIMLNSAEWTFGLLGPFLGLIIYWPWRLYKWTKEMEMKKIIKKYDRETRRLSSQLFEPKYTSSAWTTTDLPLSIITEDLFEKRWKSAEKFEEFGNE